MCISVRLYLQCSSNRTVFSFCISMCLSFSLIQWFLRLISYQVSANQGQSRGLSYRQIRLWNFIFAFLIFILKSWNSNLKINLETRQQIMKQMRYQCATKLLSALELLSALDKFCTIICPWIGGSDKGSNYGQKKEVRLYVQYLSSLFFFPLSSLFFFGKIM